MENNNENKAKFFAQYWGQMNVYSNLLNLRHVSISYVVNQRLEKIENCYLQLKPLESITDEDAIEVYGIVGDTMFIEHNDSNDKLKIGIIRMLTEFTGSWLHVGNCLQATDYLRSKGYALPFTGLSVEELVNRGWIKLKH